MKNYRYRIVPILFGFITLLLTLSACNSPIPSETDFPEATLTPSPLETVTETSPTVTPTSMAERVILLIAPDADAFVVTQVTESLEELAVESGFVLDIQEGVSIDTLNNVPVVLAIGESIDVSNLAAEHPNVSFVAVGNPRITPSANVSVIGDPDIDQNHRAFMAGYLAALISTDYKVAALAPSGLDITEPVLESFVVGMRFFCGICQTKYPPYQPYPQWETLPLDSSAETFQPVLQKFVDFGIEVIYVQGDLISPSLLTAISDLNITVVSDKQPETIRNNYAGTILSDPGPVLEMLWQDILNGNNGLQQASLISLVDRNPEHISEGRYQFFKEMAADLEAGLVLPEAVP